MKIAVTGSDGFIARNLLAHLKHCEGADIQTVNRTSNRGEWEKLLIGADVVFHLAGVNRPQSEEAFKIDNNELTAFLVDSLEKSGHFYKLIFSSSTQADLDNSYGRSKKYSEEYIQQFVKNGSAIIYRLPGVFGKWSRPNYNSVVSTFCYNIANDLPIQVSEHSKVLKIVYIDDVVKSFISQIHNQIQPGEIISGEIKPEHHITLGKLAETIKSFRANRKTLFVPDVGDALEKALYSTWLSYLPETHFSYELELKTDNRGSLFELLKSKNAGQIFISTTFPGITRGNHFHHTKTEKFIVIQGEGLIQFRSVLGTQIIEYRVSGKSPVVVDIPPGYTHNIINVGEEIMVTLFWANEIFDAQKPDTIFEKV